MRDENLEGTDREMVGRDMQIERKRIFQNGATPIAQVNYYMKIHKSNQAWLERRVEELRVIFHTHMRQNIQSLLTRELLSQKAGALRYMDRTQRETRMLT